MYVQHHPQGNAVHWIRTFTLHAAHSTAPSLPPLLRVLRHLLRRLRLRSRLIKKAQVAKPFDEPLVPRPVRRPTSRTHRPTMSASTVDMHFQFWRRRIQHRPKVIIRPHRVHAIPDPAQAMKLGGTFAGIGVSGAFVNGVGPG